MDSRASSDVMTLLMELRDSPDDDTTLDLDRYSNICAITIEHASQRAGAPEFTYEQVRARA